MPFPMNTGGVVVIRCEENRDVIRFGLVTWSEKLFLAETVEIQCGKIEPVSCDQCIVICAVS